MNIEALANSLKPWMRVRTWDTEHPCDLERFHKALNSAIDLLGCQISYDDFRNAMELLSEQLYASKYNAEYLQKKINDSASRAETITSYIYDVTKNP